MRTLTKIPLARIYIIEKNSLFEPLHDLIESKVEDKAARDRMVGVR
jgi:hypothetical protein